jgi:DNA repair protein RadA/Sms
MIPAADLGIISAVASSALEKAIPPDFVLIGEVGLAGEVRSVGQLKKRLKEAKALGFTQALIPHSGKTIHQASSKRLDSQTCFHCSGSV